MIAVIDYGLSDTETITKALSDLKSDYIITNKEYDIIKSEKIILTGGGEISKVINQLHKNNLFTMLRVCKKPILGINTGMQVFGDYVKGRNISGLGIFPGFIEKFDSEISKVPLVGFNIVEIKTKSKLFNGIERECNFYFEHSYYLPINICTTSASNNNTSFSASVENGNYYGVQFHPEKSGEAGLKLLKNFIEL
jgi:imidazole glycerol-phosphate synthase subunit HisH